MTTTVRLYTHEGVQAMPVASYSGQLSTNGQFALRQPYLHGEVLTADTGAAVASTAATLAPETDNNVKLLMVQIQPSKRIHYEVTPLGRDARTATTSSPIIASETVLTFGPGWAISVLEASDSA